MGKHTRKKLVQQTQGITAALAEHAAEADAPAAAFFVDTTAGAQSRKERARTQVMSYERVFQGTAGGSGPISRPPAVARGPNKHEQRQIERILAADELGAHADDGSTSGRALQAAQKAGKGAVSGMYDLWAVAPSQVANASATKTAARPLRSLRPTGKLRAIGDVLPEPGESYNPTYEDHQDQLGEAIAQQLAIERENKRIQRETSKAKGTKRAKAAAAEAAAAEAQAEADAAAAAAAQGGAQAVLVKPSTAITRREKTTAQRNKEKRAQRREYLLKRRKIKKQQQHALNNWQAIVKAEKKKEQLAAERRKAAALKAETAIGPPKLGPNRYEEPLKPVLLSSQLPASLSAIPAVVNPVENMFHKLQKKGLIEVRHKQVKRQKYARKLYPKRNMDDD